VLVVRRTKLFNPSSETHQKVCTTRGRIFIFKKMAAPFKTGLVFFYSHCTMSMKDERFIDESGAEGWLLLHRIKQHIGSAGFFIAFDDDLLFTLRKASSLSDERIQTILNSCIKWGYFHKGIFDKYGVLTSVEIQTHFFEVIKKRRWKYQVERQELLLICVNAALTPVKTEETQDNPELSPTKERKEKELLEPQPKKDSYSTLGVDKWKQFFVDRGSSEELGVEFFELNEGKSWIGKDGRPVKNRERYAIQFIAYRKGFYEQKKEQQPETIPVRKFEKENVSRIELSEVVEFFFKKGGEGAGAFNFHRDKSIIGWDKIGDWQAEALKRINGMAA
jgi:hypothetical protein